MSIGDQTLLQSQVFLLLDREGIVQMRGSTADTCTCYSLRGIRFNGALTCPAVTCLMSVPSEQYRIVIL